MNINTLNNKLIDEITLCKNNLNEKEEIIIKLSEKNKMHENNLEL